MNSLADLLEQATGHSVQISGTGSVGGGCIHNFGSGYLAAANRMITDLQAAATDGEVSE